MVKGVWICTFCKRPVVLIPYALGAQWMHVVPGAGLSDAYEFCKTTVATPEELS